MTKDEIIEYFTKKGEDNIVFKLKGLESWQLDKILEHYNPEKYVILGIYDDYFSFLPTNDASVIHFPYNNIPNIELLDKAIKIIQEHPENWNQETWHCGTSHCLAGHIRLLLEGFPPDYNVSVGQSEDFISQTQEIATKALNIPTKYAANIIFWYDNTLDDIINYRNQLAEHGYLIRKNL